MRDINDIIKELEEHPDIIFLDYWTKEDIIKEIQHQINNDGSISKSTYSLDKEFLTNDDWELIDSELQVHYDVLCLKNLFGKDLQPNLWIRIMRDIKLHQIVDKK